MVAAAGLVLVIALLMPSPEDKVVFMDVGQGDAILLQNGTQQALIDGGPGMAVLARLGEEMPWFDRKIELLVLTHPERDHLEGLLHVLERYEVGAVLFPKVKHDTLMYGKWLDLLAEKEIPHRFAWAGQQVEMGDVRMTLLGPIPGKGGRGTMTTAKKNNASVMMRVDFQGLSFLLTGDAEKAVEGRLVNEYGNSRVAGASLAASSTLGDRLRQTPSVFPAAGLLDVDILKAGHHGSNTSTHEQLIGAASPKAAVISVGKDNKFGHPRKEVLARLKEIPIWRTDERGSVRFEKVNEEWFLR